jgi:hypothetical protein
VKAAARTTIVTPDFSARYRVATKQCGGRCPVEAGLIGRLADHECRHGRLPFDRTAACGCWAEEGATVLELRRPHPRSASSRRAA